MLAYWNDYYFGKVIEINPLKLMFTYEPVGSSGEVKLTGKTKTWNKNDVQQADKNFIVCYIPTDILQPTKAGLEIVNKEKCVDFIAKEIATYEL